MSRTQCGSHDAADDERIIVSGAEGPSNECRSLREMRVASAPLSESFQDSFTLTSSFFLHCCKNAVEFRIYYCCY